LDIGIGLFLSVWIGLWFGVEAKFWFLLFGIGAILAPDLDVPVYVLIKRRIENRTIHKHREILHYPLPFLAVTPAIYFWLGLPASRLWFYAILCHFIHDSVDDDGWGIQWFWPFSKKFFMLTKHSDNMVFEEKERENLAKKHADPNWLRNTVKGKENIWHSAILILGLFCAFLWLLF